jgi:hypothetical protein
MTEKHNFSNILIGGIHMIRLSANLSKKVPIPGCEYSSQQYGASLEIEVSDADKPDAIQARIRELYTLLSNSIDAQLSGATNYPETAPTPALPPPTVPQPVQQQPAQQRVGYAVGRNRVAAVNGNGNGRRATCTEAQAKCIYAICKAQGLDLPAVLADFNVSHARDLHVKDASRLIDQLKARQNGAAY